MTLASLLALGEAQRWNISLLVLLLKATLILIAALGITLAMQRASAGTRHLVWLVTLVALALIPALTAWGPLRIEVLSPVAASGRGTSRTSTRVTNDAHVTLAPHSAVSARGATGSTIDATPASRVSSSDVAVASAGGTGVLARVRNASVWSLLLVLWGAVVLVLVASLAWSSYVVRRLVLRSRPLDDQSWLAPLYEVSDRLGLSEPPRLMLSSDAKMPFACGLLHPTIVLPAESESWSHERRLAVLLHELAHVRRHDLIGHTLGRLVCAVYWFHPLVWTAARELRSESERACDDLALSCGTRAADYAEHLLEIVTSVRRERTPMVALAMARRKEFEGRMLAILDSDLRHAAPSRRQSMTLIGALGLISVVVGAAAPAPRQAPQHAPRSVATSVASATSATSAASATSPSAASAATPFTSASAVSSAMPTLATSRASSAPMPSANPQSTAPVPTVEPFVQTDTKSEMTMHVVESTAVEHAVRIVNGLAPRLSVSMRGSAKQGGSHETATAQDDRPVLLAKVLRSDSSASLRRVAAWGLAEFAETPVAAEALSAALRRDGSAEVREMAAWALGNGEETSVATDALRAALHSDASVEVRRTAAWALGSIGDEGAVSTLVGALSDASADVRYRAAWALGTIEPHPAPKQLVAMLGDKDPRVRELVAWALYQIEDPSAAPALQAALKAESSSDLQLAYIRALGALGEQSVDAIRGLLESPDQKIRSMAIHALAGGRAQGPWPRPMPMPRPNP